MDSIDIAVGNPISLIIERLVYLGIGLFFIIAFTSGVRRNKKEDDSK